MTEACAMLVALSPDQRKAIDFDVPAVLAYKRFHDKFTRVEKAIANGFFVIDGERSYRVNPEWFGNALCRLSIPDDLPKSHSIAVDGTDWPTSARVLFNLEPPCDGEAPRDTNVDPDAQEREANARRTASKSRWPQGPDGRSVCTADPDARGGHRSANNTHDAGQYVGYELHLATQIPDTLWSGDPRRMSLGHHLPLFITGVALAPAGTHRAKAAMPMILGQAPRINEVAWDRGYSPLLFEHAHGPLWANGIQPIFDLTQWQRKYPDTHPDFVIIDGHPFHRDVPIELRDLPMPPRGAPADIRAQYQEAFNRRAMWRYSKHSGPDNDNYTRWICPFHAGRLKCRALRQKKVNAGAVLVELPEGTTRCCNGTITLPSSHLRTMQADAVPFGTTAWAISRGRRNLVETSNSALSGRYINLDRDYTRLFGLTKHQFVIAFTMAGHNRLIADTWRAGVASDERRAAHAAKKTRQGRRHDKLAINQTKATSPSTSRPAVSTPRTEVTTPAWSEEGPPG